MDNMRTSIWCVTELTVLINCVDVLFFLAISKCHVFPLPCCQGQIGFAQNILVSSHLWPPKLWPLCPFFFYYHLFSAIHDCILRMSAILHMQEQSRYSRCAQGGATFHILQHSVSCRKSELIISLPVSLPQYKAASEMSIVMRVDRVGLWKWLKVSLLCPMWNWHSGTERERRGQEPACAQSCIPAEANYSISYFHQSRGWIIAIYVLWFYCKKNIVCLTCFLFL